MEREKALELLHRYVKDTKMRYHSYSSEAVMKDSPGGWAEMRRNGGSQD